MIENIPFKQIYANYNIIILKQSYKLFLVYNFFSKVNWINLLLLIVLMRGETNIMLTDHFATKETGQMNTFTNSVKDSLHFVKTVIINVLQNKFYCTLSP